MNRNVSVGATLHAFVAEGATVVWADAMRGLQENYGQQVGVLALHDFIERDGASQPMFHDQNYIRFIDSGITVDALQRSDDSSDSLPICTTADLERIIDFANTKNVLTTLEEYPLDTLELIENEVLPPVVANLYRSGEFKSDEHIQALIAGMGRGIIARVTVDADASRDAYIQRGISPNAITVIHNGIDTVRFVPSDAERGRVRKELKIGDDAPTILLVARYSPEKDIPLFVQSSRFFLEREPLGHVIMAGAGLTETNQSFADLLIREGFDEKSNIRQHLHAVGSRPDLPAFHNASDVLAITSVTESRPLTISEAQAAGLGVAVSTDVGDAAAMIGPHGFITGRNPAEIAYFWSEAYKKRAELRFPLERRDELGTARMITKYNQVISEVTA
jgi:glycosyltransferase involved in cell wall biosynthesis